MNQLDEQVAGFLPPRIMFVGKKTTLGASIAGSIPKCQVQLADSESELRDLMKLLDIENFESGCF